MDDVPDRPDVGAGPGAARLLDRVVRHRTFADGAGIGLALWTVFTDVSPECRPTLRARAPDDAAHLRGEPEWEAGFYAMRWPDDPPVPVSDASSLRDSAGIWIVASGESRPGPSLRMSDGTELAIPGAPAGFSEGTPVEVVGIAIPAAPLGDPDPRGRIVQIRSVRAR